LELFQLSDHLPLAKEVLQEVKETPQAKAVPPPGQVLQ